MTHVENIKKLFSKDFVEHALIESFEAGTIHLPTGQLVVCDPLVTSEMSAFSSTFPTGDFPVVLHKERDTNCVAYVELVFSKKPTAEWIMATTEGQEISDLQEGEIFGFPVESGMGCIMDVQTQKNLNELEQQLFHRKGADFMGIYEEFFHEHFFDEDGAIDQFAFLRPDEEKPGNLFAFETGYGEGFYATYLGLDAEKQPVKAIVEFIEII